MLPDASIYTDFAGLTALRARAQQNAGETLGEVAEQFEAIFLQMMIKSMRQTTNGDALLGRGGELYSELFDQQIALDLAGSKRFGLARSLIESIQGFVPGAIPEDLTTGRGTPVNLSIPPVTHVARSRPIESQSPLPGPTRLAETPEAFVDVLWPQALRAGESLGVDPRLLIAQAALETGWGRAVIHDGEGRSSYNLFGIKADSRWEGARMEVPTLEYVDGVMVKTRAPFRAYVSIEESFSDYVQFIREQPRYQAAMQTAGDPERYMRELQKAGYATDPAYADKILNVFRREELSRLMDTAGGGI